MAPDLPPGFLRAILALPDDDGPRLCAADWWDEQGAAERAEFVRVQCELVTIDRELSEHSSDSKGTCICQRCVILRKAIAPLRRRERELLRSGPAGESNSFNWCPDMVWSALRLGTDRLALIEMDEYKFRRGFVEEVTCPAADFLAHADAIRAACPLRRVRLTTHPDLRVNRGYTYSLPGRPVALARWARWGGESWDSFVLRLLAAEFPGIGFEMPAVEFRPGSLAPSELPLTTDG